MKTKDVKEVLGEGLTPKIRAELQRLPDQSSCNQDLDIKTKAMATAQGDDDEAALSQERRSRIGPLRSVSSSFSRCT